MTITHLGSLRFKVYGALLLVNTVVLGLSGHINHFQEFFYKADVFPLALSLATEFVLILMMIMDFQSQNAFTARPPFELGWLFLFGTLWLSFNAFSTSRWRYVSMGLCGTIPGDAQYAPYRTWCHELQALRVFVWIEWVMFLFTFAFLLRWAVTQHNKGRHDIWTTSFSRFTPAPASARHRGDTNSEFLQWEKFPTPAQSPQQETQIQQYRQNEQGYPPPEHYLQPEQYPQPEQYSQSGQYSQPEQYSHFEQYPQSAPYPQTAQQFLPSQRVFGQGQAY